MSGARGKNLTVGILQCGEVLEVFQPRFGDYTTMIEDKLTAVDPALSCRSWRVLDGEVPDPGMPGSQQDHGTASTAILIGHTPFVILFPVWQRLEFRLSESVMACR